MSGVQPASVYDQVSDLWIVTTYFNPIGYRSRLRNYEVFRERIVASGLPLLTVECAFGDAPFSLPPTPGLLRVRSPDVMWLKERLLNVAISRLPLECAKVAWVDADTLFENSSWAVETSRLLDEYQVVQPFAAVLRLPPGCNGVATDTEVLHSFAAAQTTDPESLSSGDFHRHGETGLAWAARRTLLADAGLYDACIIGGGDHVMAHAMCGDWRSRCMERLVGLNTPQQRYVQQWGERIFARVGGTIGYVPGVALHLWHGQPDGRRYTVRHRELAGFAFDPERDLRLNASGCWEWASNKPDMHRWAAEYFAARREDDAAALAAEPLGGAAPLQRNG